MFILYQHIFNHYVAVVNFVALSRTVTDEELTAKVSDFGLSYEMTEREKLKSDSHISRTNSTIQQVPQPIWWMSPECIEKRIYDEKTDVWSFGILMWEIMSKGATPFSTYKWNGEQKFVHDLKRGVKPATYVEWPDVVTRDTGYTF